MSQAEAIEQFKIISKNLKGQNLCTTINQYTQHARIFQFTELFQLPQVKALAQGEFQNYYNLLQLFAYGNYSQWKQNTSKFQLNEQQIRKIRQLTIIDLCIRQTTISYDLLKIELELQNDEEIDTLLIDSIYEGIISGKIDQANHVFKVSSSISRDLKEEDLGDIKRVLDMIYQKNKEVQTTLERRIEDLHDQKKVQQVRIQQQRHEQAIARASSDKGKQKR